MSRTRTSDRRGVVPMKKKSVKMPPVGTPVTFRASTGRELSATLSSSRIITSEAGTELSIQIDGDPFPVQVPARQVHVEGVKIMTTATKTKKSKSIKSLPVKTLRLRAKKLEVAGYEGMSKAELVEAVSAAQNADSIDGDSKPATRTRKAKSTKAAAATKGKKTTSKKTAAKKVSKPKEDADPGNPFRKDTNLWHITEALKKGGKRSTLVKRLDSKLTFNPRKQSEDDFDREAEIDRRLKVVGYILRNEHGWTYEHEGRGPDAKIRATPPS